jgi:hypothetical protein
VSFLYIQRRRPPLRDADFFRGARVDAGVVGAKRIMRQERT